jgi:heat induced stress protein YflT
MTSRARPTSGLAGPDSVDLQIKEIQMNDRDDETTRTSRTVVALFHSQADAEEAIHRLKEEGFSEHQIGVAIKDRGRQEELVQDTGVETAEGAATGALGGGVLGGVIGLLAGVGTLAIPGVGPIIAGGTLASTLAGAGIGAAAGGLLGALVGMGVPEEDAQHFDQGFRAGGTLLTVAAGDRVEEARVSLHESGADLGSLRQEAEPWRGNERRYHHDNNYQGPERRLSRV